MSEFIAKTKKKLAEGVKNKEDLITIPVPNFNEEKEKNPERSDQEIKDEIKAVIDLKKGVVRIHATGRVAWAIAIGAIAVAVGIIIASGGVGFFSAPLIAPVAVSTLGLSTTVTAIGIAVAGGGVSALNRLRKYDIVENNDERLVLKRR